MSCCNRLKRITLLSGSITLICTLSASSTISACKAPSLLSSPRRPSITAVSAVFPPRQYLSPHRTSSYSGWSSVQAQTISKLRQDVSVNSHPLTPLPGVIFRHRQRCFFSATASRPPVGPSQHPVPTQEGTA